MPLPILICLMVLVTVTGCASLKSPGRAAGAATQAYRPPVKRPNIVFVLTDDLTADLLAYMPNVQKLQQDGRSFGNYFVTDSFCCPSRSSIFTGQFPHDTGVYTNSGPNGGFNKFTKTGKDRETFAIALQQAGYRTAMMGKYLNGYNDDTRYVPPGWSQWDVAGNGYHGYNYVLNENGTGTRYGRAPADYLTDVLSAKGQRFVANSAAEHKPFFLEIASFTPHIPATPAPQDLGKFLGLKAPRGAAFNPADTDGRPAWLKSYKKLTPKQISTIDQQYILRAQSVQAVDRMLGQLRAQLERLKLSGSTYVVFSSDNGYHMGQYRLMPGKTTAYDTDIKVPLIVSGPGVKAASTTTSLTENTDLAPTFEDLAGVKIPATVDGRSLLPLLLGHTDPTAPKAVLVEHHGPSLIGYDPDRPGPAAGNPPSYVAIRTPTALYVEYKSGDKEYYDLTTDPNELTNAVTTLPAPDLARLQKTLHALETCKGTTSCLTAAHPT